MAGEVMSDVKTGATATTRFLMNSSPEPRFESESAPNYQPLPIKIAAKKGTIYSEMAAEN